MSVQVKDPRQRAAVTLGDGMTSLAQHQQGNLLLATLPGEDYQRLAPQLERLEAVHGYRFCQAGQPVEHVYFPQGGIASVTSQGDPMKVEIGVIGREGLVGVPVLLGADSSPVSTFVQMPGSFLRLPVSSFLDFVHAHPDSQKVLLRFVQSFIVQVSSTAVANASYNVEQRLARWLLMAHDRADSDQLSLTHDFLSMMLGVRRPGVTVATHVLEGEHAIRATRGAIRVVDREKLKVFAGDSYGLAEAEYLRLIGTEFTRDGLRPIRAGALGAVAQQAA